MTSQQDGEIELLACQLVQRRGLRLQWPCLVPILHQLHIYCKKGKKLLNVRFFGSFFIKRFSRRTGRAEKQEAGSERLPQIPPPLTCPCACVSSAPMLAYHGSCLLLSPWAREQHPSSSSKRWDATSLPPQAGQRQTSSPPLPH